MAHVYQVKHSVRQRGRRGRFPLFAEGVIVSTLWTTLFFAGLLLFTGTLYAQESLGMSEEESIAAPAGKTASEPATFTEDGAEKSPLFPGKKRIRVDEGITFWLLDEDGKWKIPLPNWSIEDVVKSLDSFGKKNATQPWTIQSLNAAGDAEEGSIRLTLEFRINTGGDSVVRVPLGLKEGIYIPENDASGTDQNFHYEGPGTCYLDIDRQSGGYVAVIHHPSPEKEDTESPSERPVDSGENSLPTASPKVADSGSDSSKTATNDGSADKKENRPTPDSSVDGKAEENVDQTAGDSSDKAAGETVETSKVSESSASTDSITKKDESTSSSSPPPVKPSVMAGDLFRFPEKEDENVDDRYLRHRHLIKMTLVFRIDSPSNDEHRLRVSFPPAVTSKVRLDVPFPDIQLTASEGTLALDPVNLNETTSEITLTGLNRTGGATELIWRKKETRVSEIPTVLQVENAVIAVTPDEQGIQYNVTLPVRSYGESLGVIRIRLPADTHPLGESIQVFGRDNSQLSVRWEEKATSGMNLSEANSLVSSSDVTSSDDSPALDAVHGEKPSSAGSEVGMTNLSILEIRLAQPTDFASIRFKAQTQTGRNDPVEEKDGAEPSGGWECVGFEVIGAQRQSGRLRVQIPNETDFDLIPENGVRTSTWTPDGERENAEFFTFFTQPFSLKARPILREARVSVVPEYQILVQDGQIRMTARFRYTVHGAQLRRLHLKTAGWFINEFDIDSPIDVGKIYLDPETEVLTLPLKSAADGEIDVRWTAVREFALDQDILEIPIPTALADWIDPAVVVIVPDDHLEMAPLLGRFVNLIPKKQRSLNLTLELPKRQQAPLVYQIERLTNEEDGKSPLFVSKVVRHEQRVRVGSETTVQLLNQPGDQIRQTLSYVVEFIPLKTISLLIPPELRDNPELTITLDGKPIPSRNIVTEPFGNAEPELFRKRIQLPGDGVIGQCELTLQYPSPKIELLPQRTNHIPINLTVPEDGTFETNRLTVKTLPGIQIFPSEPAAQSWNMEEGKSDETVNRREFHFTTRQKERQISLRGIIKGEGALGSTVIERLWIQTWLNATNRFERIACRIVSDQDSFFIKLPGQVRQDQLEIKLDGVPYFDRDFDSEIVDSENRIEIHPNSHQKKKTMILEVSYLIPVVKDRFGDSLTFPEFGDESTWVRRCYWQVILPTNKHLFGEPENWTPEFYDLTWSGFFFRRVASMGTEELGTWVGASTIEKIPQGANVYLFSSFDPPKTCRLKIVDRAILILIGSGVLLAFGLVFVYFPRFRYAEVILIVILLSIGIFIFRPVVVLVFLQTSVIGVVLTLFAYVFKRLIGRKVENLPVSREASDIRERPSVADETSSSKSSQLAEEK